MELEQLRNNIKQQLKDTRYKHSLGVEEVSYDLALINGYDTEKASIAGLLHDCAKYLSNEELIEGCHKYHLPVSEIETESMCLLHSKVGAVYAKDKYGVEDEDILNAITYHTTGRPAMALLEKIVFIADYIEPYRDPLPNLDEIRKIAYENLDQAIVMISENTLDYLKDIGVAIDTMTNETYEYYKSKLQMDMQRKGIVMDNSKEMTRLAYEALEEKKGEDIQVIEIKDISIIADYFIIANGTNSSQVDALVNSVRDTLGKIGIEPKRIEGVRSASWILMDYGDIIVHVFSKEDRLFYNLERIWRDGKTVSKQQLEA